MTFRERIDRHWLCRLGIHRWGTPRQMSVPLWDAYPMADERRPWPQPGEPVEYDDSIWIVVGPTAYYSKGFDEPSETWFILEDPQTKYRATVPPHKFTREATQVVI